MTTAPAPVDSTSFASPPAGRFHTLTGDFLIVSLPMPDHPRMDCGITLLAHENGPGFAAVGAAEA